MASTEWLSNQMLADEFGVSIETVRKWRVKGTGPRGHKIGGLVRYRRGDVEAWLTKQAV